MYYIKSCDYPQTVNIKIKEMYRRNKRIFGRR